MSEVSWLGRSVSGFNDFHRLGRFSRLNLARRFFGHDRVDGEIKRLRVVLAGWGTKSGAMRMSCYRGWPARFSCSIAARMWMI